MELKEAENIVRAYYNNQHPLTHEICELPAGDQLSCTPQPDEIFEFPDGMVAIEYESEMPLMSMQKYQWLLTNKADFLPEGKKLAVVVIVLDAAAQPKEQVERMKAVAEKLQTQYAGRFFSYYVGAHEATVDTVSAALRKAYEAVQA